jgi:hypothetical protein
VQAWVTLASASSSPRVLRFTLARRRQRLVHM